MDHAEDGQIVSAVLAGDVNAYAVLVGRYQKPIYNLMVRMTRCEADAHDLAQETFIKAYENLHRFHRNSRFFPWLYTIGLNAARNFLRRNKVLQTTSIDDCNPGSGLDYVAQEEDKLCARLDYQRVVQALDRLAFEYREAVILRYHHDLPMEDVATALGISLSNAKMRVHRALLKVREILNNGEKGS